MTFRIFISSAVVTALATIISSIIAKRTAEATANKELEKIKYELDHLDKVRAEDAVNKLDEEFSALISAINNYIFMPDLTSQAAAATAVTAFMRHNIAEMTVPLRQILEAIDHSQSDTVRLQTVFRPLLNQLTSSWNHPAQT